MDVSCNNESQLENKIRDVAFSLRNIILKEAFTRKRPLPERGIYQKEAFTRKRPLPERGLYQKN